MFLFGYSITLPFSIFFIPVFLGVFSLRLTSNSLLIRKKFFLCVCASGCRAAAASSVLASLSGCEKQLLYKRGFNLTEDQKQI